jgi:hypothetical protein
MSGWRKRQVMELALEALETAEIDGNCEYGATEIIRKALAQPEYIGFMDSKLNPIQRTWVGLTDEEISNLWSWAMTREAELTATTQQHAFARAIEAKLKEKNFD